jgi:membrane fusion protein (multidrug efflux system)
MKHIIYFGLAFTMLAACSGETIKNDGKEKEELAAEPVEVLVISTREITRDVEYTSTVLAWEEVHYAPAAPGRIDNIFVKVGQRVAEGELLVQMDQTQLHQAEVQLQTLKTDFARIDTLNKTGSIPRQQYDQLKAQLDIAQSNVNFLKENTKLTAPFYGIVSGKYFEAGEMYSGAPIPTIGKSAILSLVQIDRLKILLAVSEKYFPMVNKGMPATVISDIYPDKVFEGKVFNIYPTIDPTSRSFNIEISLDNTGELLRPGMFCRVRLDLDREEAIVLPSIAILKLQGSNDRYLFIEENGIAKRIPVTLGKRYNEFVEVISDELKEGDKLIIRGQVRLLDGMRVTVN